MAPKKAGMVLLTILRAAIGWHFLYEGFAKLLDPEWTAAGYLESATGTLAPVFRSLAANDSLLAAVNILNTWGLLLIGLGLFLGLFTRIAQMAGILLLLLYYLSHPPLFTEPGFFREGSYFIISKDVLEMLALVALMFFPTGKFLGLDGLLESARKLTVHRMDHGVPDTTETKTGINGIRRREMLRHLATIPFLGAVVYGAIRRTGMASVEEQNLVDSASGATARFVRQIMAGSSAEMLKDLKGKQFTDETALIRGKLPTGMLGNMETSKLILGGNLLSGYVHSRDLIYVSTLVLNYHQKDRIFRTLMLAEQSGINTLLSNPVVMPLMEEYWKEGYGKIQFISDMAGLDYSGPDGPRAMDFGAYQDLVKNAIDKGATSGYIQGETADYYIEHNEPEKLVKVMDIVRNAGLPVGIGAHKIETVKRCVELGLEH
ncbi:MAG: DoxX family membrane protein, partial [Bacteroidetes bacterium]